MNELLRICDKFMVDIYTYIFDIVDIFKFVLYREVLKLWSNPSFG